MKIAYLSVGLLALFSPLTAAWSKEDREIFRIRDEISSHEPDPAATFYDILGVSTSASHDEITKAYRGKTRSLHPDKVKQQMKKSGNSGGKDGKPPTKAQINAAVKDASERQARLSLIANILRGPLRDRYDHFLAHGFPLWKGTDYYYNRYRPGLGTAVLGAFLMGGGAVHYLILYMGWKRQKEFIERYVRFAREAAWGKSLAASIPGVDTPPPAPAPVADDDDEEGGGPMQPMNRKQRRMQEKETKKEESRGSGKKARKAKGPSVNASRDASAAPTGARKRVVAENGKILVVDSLGGVYLEEEDEDGIVQEFLLDPDELAAPTIKDTAIVRLPLWILSSTVGRLLPKSSSAEADTAAEAAAEDDDSEAPQDTPSTDSAGEDFELLDKSTDSLTAKATATGAQQGGKAKKRRGRK